MGSDQSSNVDVDFGRLFASLREKWVRILAASLSAAVIAFILASLAAPGYRAETRILIDTREVVNSGRQPALDNGGLSGQVAVIASPDILKKVADDLDLADDGEFKPAALSIFGRLMVMAGLRTDPGNLAPGDRVLRRLRENLEILPVTDSVIAVRFSSHDPELAAKVPNAIADAFLEVRKQAGAASATTTADWLKPEIDALRKDVHAAESKVADFRAKSGLITGQNDQALAARRLSDVAGELSRLRAERTEAQARADAIRAALQDGTATETLPALSASASIRQLHERQAELRSRIADLSTTLLPNHPRIRALDSQLLDLDRQIRAEAQKVVEEIGTQAETSRLREQELAGELATLKAEAVRADRQQVELRALQREADAKRQLLESYITRYNDALARGTHMPPDARVIARAVTPNAPSFPKILPVTAAAFIAAFALTMVITLLTEFSRDRAVRPAAASIAAIPQVAMPGVSASPVEEAAMAEEGDPHEEQERRLRTPHPEAPPQGTARLGIEAAAGKLAAESIDRAVFVSPEDHAGAVSSVLVARMVADSGLRVIMIDLTTFGTASVPMLETTAFPGITNLLASEAQFCDVIRGDLYSDCHIIPVGTASELRAMRAADRLSIIADSLATAYDIVIIECGAANVDALQRVVGTNCIIMVSALDPDHEPAAGTAKELAAAFPGEAVLVTPATCMPPVALRGRDAA